MKAGRTFHDVRVLASAFQRRIDRDRGLPAAVMERLPLRGRPRQSGRTLQQARAHMAARDAICRPPGGTGGKPQGKARPLHAVPLSPLARRRTPGMTPGAKGVISREPS